jgi:NAD dependent epimerase/dehydratase family enzyme
MPIIQLVMQTSTERQGTIHARLDELGYQFRHPELGSALRDVLAR